MTVGEKQERIKKEKGGKKGEVELRNRNRNSVWKEGFKSMQGIMYSMPTLFTEHVAGLMISRLLATIE